MQCATAAPAPQPRPFGMRDKIGYALGDFGCNMSFSLISSFIIPFYTQYIGLTERTWAVIILLLKIWDAVNDPIMGTVMDHVRTGGGSKFKPWIRWGSYGLVITGALIFMPIPGAAYWVKVAVCMAAYLAWDFCYTLVNVPYGAISAAITVVPQQRQALSTFRSIGANAGGTISTLLPLLVYGKDNNLVGGRFLWIGTAMGLFAFVSFNVMLRMTTERVQAPPPPENEKPDYLRTLRGFLTNRPLLGLSLASVASIVFFATTTYTNQLVFQCYFQDIKFLTVASFVNLPGLVLMVAVGPLVKRFGKKLASGVPLLFSVAAAAVMLLIPFDPAKASSPWLWILFSILVQTGSGIFSLTCWAMVSDCIDYQQWKTGRREEGSVYAMYSLFRKMAQGVGASLIPLSMTWVGYQSRMEALQNPGVPEKIRTMAIILLLIGSVIMAVSLLFVYSLDEKKLAKMNDALGYISAQADAEPAG